jgi:ParB-like nuclease family protein
MADELTTKTTGETQAPLVETNACDNQMPVAAPPSGVHVGADQRIEMIPISALTPYKRNPRSHSRKQVRQVAESIKQFGFNNAVLIDDSNQIIAGHCRVAAAKLLGLPEVPTRRLTHMSEDEVRAYIIADNKLAEQAGWDREVLAAEITVLIDHGFDLGVIGFDPGEIEIILDDADEAKREAAGPEDHVPEVGRKAISRPGDLWLLGKHRIFCGDALGEVAYSVLLMGDKAEMVFTDPPYNVPVEGHVCGLGGIHHREFAMASGEMSPEEFTAFLKSGFQRLANNTTDGSIHYICMDWRHIAEMMAAGNDVYDELKNLCVWAKTNGGMGTFYRSRHELVFVWKSGTAPHINNFELGQHGRCRTNVWEYPGISSMGAGRRAHEGTRHAPDRQAGRTGGRCHKGLLPPQWSYPRSVSRLRHDGDRRRADWSSRPRHRDRSGLCRRRGEALARLYREVSDPRRRQKDV